MTEGVESGWTLLGLRQALDDFRRHLEATTRESLTVHTYTDQAGRFVRWLAGEYRPRNLGSAIPPRPLSHTWTSSDLFEDHRRYREMLLRARLKPLASQTYVHASGVFVSWLTGSRLPRPRTAPSQAPTPATEKEGQSVSEGPDDWLWEGNVQRVLRDWLVSEGWAVISEADPAIRQRGVDLLLQRGARQLAIEVKGYPQAIMRRGVNKGKARIYHPASQAGQYFAGALQSAVRMRDALPQTEVAIALPDTPRYRDLLEKSVRSLQDLGVGIFLVRQNGSAHQEISPRRR